MNIYLDTSHLQKWQQKTLSSNEIFILNSLRDSGDHVFILSIAHIFDITDREDREKAITIARFLDKLPKKWIRNAVDLKKEEIKNAVHCFNKSISLINPFLPDYVDTLEPEASTALGINLIYRGSSIEKIVSDLVNTDIKERQGSLTKEKLYNWSHNNKVLISMMKDGEIKNKQMQKNLRRVLRDDINQFALYGAIADAVITDEPIDPVDTFIDWLIKNPRLISSIWCPYYTEHFMLRNTTMVWQKSHIEDLIHLAALPYVDYLTVDNQIQQHSSQALKFFKRHIPNTWDSRIITSINKIKC